VIRKILLGYDGSPSSEDAMALAVDLTQKYGAELHVLAVARPPEFGDEVETEAAVESARKHSDRVLARARLQLGPTVPGAKMHSAVGHPAEQIVRYAEAHAVDHIVVGHRGHTLFERWLIGSVARQVIAHAPCAVTVVRSRARASARRE
jgi:nucleotide-binding universal stress UspA family protein